MQELAGGYEEKGREGRRREPRRAVSSGAGESRGIPKITGYQTAIELLRSAPRRPTQTTLAGSEQQVRAGHGAVTHEQMRISMRLSDPPPKLRDGLEDRDTAGHFVCRRRPKPQAGRSISDNEARRFASLGGVVSEPQ